MASGEDESAWKEAERSCDRRLQHMEFVAIEWRSGSGCRRWKWMQNREVGIESGSESGC